MRSGLRKISQNHNYCIMPLTSYHYKGDKPTRKGFGEGLRELGSRNPQVIGLGADITASVSMDLFAKTFPERFFSFGIAEQNITALAAGLALSGKIPFFSTYGVFSALRNTDQLRISVCYNNLNVKIGGAHAGISVGPDGGTHQALEDIAIMRVLPNMHVLSPCDATQARLACIAAAEQIDGPVYIRFGRESMPDFTPDDQKFTFGKAQIMREGSDIGIIATGHLTWEAIQASEQLEKVHGIKAAVLNMHTIKPLDEEAVIHLAKSCGKIITAEEHQIIGGLGSAVCEALSEKYPVPVKRIGINDRFGESGNAVELMQHYGLTAAHIARTALDMGKIKPA